MIIMLLRFSRTGKDTAVGSGGTWKLSAAPTCYEDVAKTTLTFFDTVCVKLHLCEASGIRCGASLAVKLLSTLGFIPSILLNCVIIAFGMS